MSVNQFLNGKLNLIAGAGGGSVIADDNTFTGTTAEVEAAIADGLIEDDTIVFITDDVEEGEAADVLDTYDEIMANEKENQIPGALGIKEGFEQTNEKINVLEENKGKDIVNIESGEDIHLTNAAEGKAVEFALFGKATQNTTSGKNLISYPYSSDSASDRNGIAWTNNDDGTIFVNGTATAISFHNLTNATTPVEENWLVLRKGTYTISDGVTNNNDVAVFLQLDSTSGPTYTDTTFTIEEDAYYKIYARVLNGKTVNNVTLKPMLRLASIEDDTYEPYTGGIPSPNPEYPQEIEISGESYNLIPYPYYDSDKTSANVEFKVSENGYITANGTSNSTNNSLFMACFGLLLKAGDYVLSGCPSGGSGSTYRLRLGYGDENTFIESDLGNGLNFTLNEDTSINVLVQVFNGYTANSLTFKPMIRKASVKNDRYMPYGKGSVEVKSVGKNLLNINTRTQTADGVTLTVNEIDKSIIANGTATKDVNFVISRYSGDASQLNGKFFSGSVGGSRATYFLRISDTVNSASDNLDGTSKISTLTNTGIIRVSLFVKAGVKLNNVKFYPMISDDGGEYQPYKETISTIPTPNGLAGIKVSSGGNYTDSNGQQWICDEIVKYADGSGEYIQRIQKIVYDGVNNSGTYFGQVTGKDETLIQMNLNNTQALYMTSKEVICDKFQAVQYNVKELIAYTCRQGTNGACCCYLPLSEGAIDVETGTAWLQENPVTVYFILKEPIRTPLTAEQLAEIEKVSTFNPVTNISNDFDCGMDVTYYVNSLDSEFVANLNDRVNNVQDTVDELNNNLEANDGLKFRFSTDGEGNYGYLGADDSFIPFKCDAKFVRIGAGNSFNIADIVGAKNVGKYSVNDFLLIPNINTSAYQMPNIQVISGQSIAKANTRIYTNKDFSISYDNTNGNVTIQNCEIMNNINFYNSSNTLLGDYWITLSVPPNVYLLVKTNS